MHGIVDKIWLIEYLSTTFSHIDLIVFNYLAIWSILNSLGENDMKFKIRIDTIYDTIYNLDVSKLEYTNV